MSYFSKIQTLRELQALARQCGKAQFANGRSCLQATALLQGYLHGYLFFGLEARTPATWQVLFNRL
jgi:hypothetical protein